MALVFDAENRLLRLGDAAARVHIRTVDGQPQPWFQAKPIVQHLGYSQGHVHQTLSKLPEKHRKSLGELLGESAPQDHNERIATYISEEGLYELSRAARKRKGGEVADTLYVMQYSFRRDIVKVGRSNNPEKRRRQLEGGQAFHVEILATFPGQGALEGQVHEALAAHRSEEGAGREWFNVTATEAIAVINTAIEDQRAGPRSRRWTVAPPSTAAPSHSSPSRGPAAGTCCCHPAAAGEIPRRRRTARARAIGSGAAAPPASLPTAAPDTPAAAPRPAPWQPAAVPA